MEGIKYDAGKVRAGLVCEDFSRALLEVSKIGTFGASKYGPSNWLAVDRGIERYSDAAWRHRLARASGQEYDSETQLLHLAHEVWNVLAVLELTLRKQEAESEKASKFYDTSVDVRGMLQYAEPCESSS